MGANSASRLPILDLENSNDPNTPHFEVSVVSHIPVTSGCIGGVMSCSLDDMTVQVDSGAIQSF